MHSKKDLENTELLYKWVESGVITGAVLINFVPSIILNSLISWLATKSVQVKLKKQNRRQFSVGGHNYC